MPRDLPPWPTFQCYFRNWRGNGTWEWICQGLCRKERVRQGRDPEPAAGTEGFAVQHRHRVVQRTLGWLSKFRRLSKDYEWQEDNSEAWIYIAMARILLRRLAHD